MREEQKTSREQYAALDEYCAPLVNGAKKIIRFGDENPFNTPKVKVSDEWFHNLSESPHTWWASNNPYFRLPLDDDFDMRTYDLRDALVAFGGSEVCMPFGESELDQLFERGQLWGPNTQMKKGDACRCHQNAALLWSKSQEHNFIATGYALSEDGMWRGHSWCVRPGADSVEVIETTVPRLLYFGYVLTLEEARDFNLNNRNSTVTLKPKALALHEKIYARQTPNFNV